MALFGHRPHAEGPGPLWAQGGAEGPGDRDPEWVAGPQLGQGKTFLSPPSFHLLSSTQEHFGDPDTQGHLCSQWPALLLPCHLRPPGNLALLARVPCSKGSLLPDLSPHPIPHPDTARWSRRLARCGACESQLWAGSGPGEASGGQPRASEGKMRDPPFLCHPCVPTSEAPPDPHPLPDEVGP